MPPRKKRKVDSDDLECAKPDSPGRENYLRAKDSFFKAHACDVDCKNAHLLDSRRLFEEYAQRVKACEPLLLNPSEDRHLFYLCEIEDIERGEKGRNWALSELAGRWNAWQRKYGTKTPKQQTAATALNHFLYGEAYYLKATALIKVEEQERKAKIRVTCNVILTSLLPKSLADLIADYLKIDCDQETSQVIEPTLNCRYLNTSLHLWGIPDVLSWLKMNGLEIHSKMFIELQVNGSILSSLTEDELQNELCITSSLHKKKILRLISNFTPLVKNTIEILETDVDWLFENACEEFEAYQTLITESKISPVDSGKVGIYLRDISRLEMQRHVFALQTVHSI